MMIEYAGRDHAADKSTDCSNRFVAGGHFTRTQ
jgi:hypothetical protein